MLFLFFFSSRRRHTRCALVTGGSDVCSSDLRDLDEVEEAAEQEDERHDEQQGAVGAARPGGEQRLHALVAAEAAEHQREHAGGEEGDRKSGVEGKSVPGRVEVGGRWVIIKK